MSMEGIGGANGANGLNDHKEFSSPVGGEMPTIWDGSHFQTPETVSPFPVSSEITAPGTAPLPPLEETDTGAMPAAAEGLRVPEQRVDMARMGEDDAVRTVYPQRGVSGAFNRAIGISEPMTETPPDSVGDFASPLVAGPQEGFESPEMQEDAPDYIGKWPPENGPPPPEVQAARARLAEMVESWGLTESTPVITEPTETTPADAAPAEADTPRVADVSPVEAAEEPVEQSTEVLPVTENDQEVPTAEEPDIEPAEAPESPDEPVEAATEPAKPAEATTEPTDPAAEADMPATTPEAFVGTNGGPDVQPETDESMVDTSVAADPGDSGAPGEIAEEPSDDVVGIPSDEVIEAPADEAVAEAATEPLYDHDPTGATADASTDTAPATGQPFEADTDIGPEASTEADAEGEAGAETETEAEAEVVDMSTDAGAEVVDAEVVEGDEVASEGQTEGTGEYEDPLEVPTPVQPVTDATPETKGAEGTDIPVQPTETANGADMYDYATILNPVNGRPFETYPDGTPIAREQPREGQGEQPDVQPEAAEKIDEGLGAPGVPDSVSTTLSKKPRNDGPEYTSWTGGPFPYSPAEERKSVMANIGRWLGNKAIQTGTFTGKSIGMALLAGIGGSYGALLDSNVVNKSKVYEVSKIPFAGLTKYSVPFSNGGVGATVEVWATSAEKAIQKVEGRLNLLTRFRAGVKGH